MLSGGQLLQALACIAYLQKRHDQADDTITAQPSRVHLVHIPLTEKSFRDHDKRSCGFLSYFLKQLRNSLPNMNAVQHIERNIDLEATLDRNELDDGYSSFSDDNDIGTNVR